MIHFEGNIQLHYFKCIRENTRAPSHDYHFSRKFPLLSSRPNNSDGSRLELNQLPGLRSGDAEKTDCRRKFVHGRSVIAISMEPRCPAGWAEGDANKAVEGNIPESPWKSIQRLRSAATRPDAIRLNLH